MAWCEAHDVDYLLGLARNPRLSRTLARDMARAQTEHEATGQPARRFRDFRYRTRTSWSRSRRVVGKAEYLPGKANPRFVVTSLPLKQVDARTLYEQCQWPTLDRSEVKLIRQAVQRRSCSPT